MKKVYLLCALLSCSSMGFAQDDYVPEAVDSYVPEVLTDSTEATPSIDDIIRRETGRSQINYTDSHYEKVWGRNTFLNISAVFLFNTKFESKQLPSAEKGTLTTLTGKFENDLGFGLQWGHTYNFHKKPIGNVMFVGVDYSWLDLNVNKYKETKLATFNCEKITETDTYPLPWGNEMWMFDYGMSLGPSLTFYPFTALRRSGTDEIRIQAYFHVGYSVGMAVINDVPEIVKGYSSSSSVSTENTKTEIAWGHGLFTSFGFNVTWKFIGLGYESRRGTNFKYKSVNSDFRANDPKFEQTINRFYLQFRL